MNNYWELYWITRLDDIKFTCAIVALLCVFAVMWCICDGDCSLFDTKEEAEKLRNRNKRVRKKATWLFFICATIVAFLPTSKDVLFIVIGGKTLNYVHGDASLQKMPAKATELIYNYMDKLSKDIKDSGRK